MPSDFGTAEHVSISYLHRFSRAPAVRAFAILSLILTLCYYYAQNNFFRDPGSAFYDEKRAFDRRYSSYREEQAKEWLRDVSAKVEAGDWDEEKHPMGAENATICASFLTVNRPGIEPYLEASIASALDRLTPAERRAIHLDVVFATTHPEEHSSYNRPWLRKVVDEVFTYDTMLLPPEVDEVRALEDAKDGLHKAPYDYTLPLRHCEDTKAKYFAIFEDDVIFAEGWLARTLLGLRDMEKKMIASKRKGEWLYMRLFNQERSTGWFTSKIGGNHEAKISFWIGSCIMVGLALMRRRSRAIRAHLDNWTLVVICAIFVPLFVILFFQAGKASMLPPSPGVLEEPFGCCAQGLIFNRIHVDGLVEYLYMRRQDGFHDMITRDYARMHDFARWSQYPMVLQHVGTHSTIQWIVTESSKVWSMAFEDLNPMRLARDHGEHVRKLFGDWALA